MWRARLKVGGLSMKGSICLKGSQFLRAQGRSGKQFAKMRSGQLQFQNYYTSKSKCMTMRHEIEIYNSVSFWGTRWLKWYKPPAS